ncbi:MAG: UDP-N-acetylmuramate--L-alanine ligase [Mariprofundaceae bacterium]
MKSRIQRIHFTGIGGIGMSGIAELLHNQGFIVQGSDQQEGANVLRLRSLGMMVHVGHHADHIGDAQVVVISSAIKSDNTEVMAAKVRGVPVIPRADMLAELMRMKQGIAIAGSHGKTTITSLIAHAMEVAGLDPTYVIGGRLTVSGDNARLGESPWLVAEADESDGSFLRLSPMIAVISNIDPEHLDHYGDFAHLLDAFAQFADHVPFYGRVVLHHEHPHVATIRERLARPVTTYGSSLQADLHLLHVEPQGMQQRLHIGRRDGDDLSDLRLAMPGFHNAENALAAIAVLLDLGIGDDLIRKAMASFGGIQRRFQCDHGLQGVLVDDYAHHPREIHATLVAARSCWPDHTITAIFQPHRYSRSHDLMNDFLGAFDHANRVLLLPVFSAGEVVIANADSETMCAGMVARGHRHVRCCQGMQEAKKVADQALEEGEIVVVMGAGSIGALATSIRTSIAEAKRDG